MLHAGDDLRKWFMLSTEITLITLNNKGIEGYVGISNLISDKVIDSQY